MSETKTRNAIWRCIQRLLRPRMWESGYVCDKEPSGHIMLWSPRVTKLFARNTQITSVWAIGKDWLSDDALGGGMVTHSFRSVPVEDLANILEWLISVDIDAVAHHKKDAA